MCGCGINYRTKGNGDLSWSRAPFSLFLKLASLLRSQFKSVHLFPGRFLDEDNFIIAKCFFFFAVV